jgi:hypothetical protein
VDGVSARNVQLLNGEAILPVAGGGEMKNINKIFSLMLVILGFSQITNAQYILFTHQNHGTNMISIPEGETWELKTFRAPGHLWFFSSTNTSFEYSNDSLIGILRPDANSLNMAFYSGTSRPFGGNAFLKGPVSAKLEKYYQDNSTNLSSYYLLFKKCGDDVNSFSGSTSVVIPSSAEGDVDVVLEQSQDGVTWTECLPGTYNSSTVKRFFRLRAVEK